MSTNLFPLHHERDAYEAEATANKQFMFERPVDVGCSYTRLSNNENALEMCAANGPEHTENRVGTQMQYYVFE